MQSEDNYLFEKEIHSIRIDYLDDIDAGRFSVMNLVESFEKILKKSGQLQDYYFSKPISTLRNTIQEIVRNGALDVFEDDLGSTEDEDSTSVEDNTSIEDNTSVDDSTSIEDNAEDENNIEVEDNTGDVTSPRTRKKYTYSLYGQEYTDNLTDMMLNVFVKVLLKHPDIVDGLENQKGMYFVSKTNYEDPVNRTDEMPSYFKSCRYFEIGTGICIGTAGIDKIRSIAALIDLCGEDRDIFQSKDVELPSPGKAEGKRKKKDFFTY